MEGPRGKMALILRWAYALAATGRYPEYSNVRKKVISEGFPEAAEWLDRPSVREVLSTICTISRNRRVND